MQQYGIHGGPSVAARTAGGDSGAGASSGARVGDGRSGACIAADCAAR